MATTSWSLGVIVFTSMSIGQGPRAHLLLVCGSLQHRSANRSALEVASAVAVAAGASVDSYDRLADVPAFDPDRTDERIDAIDDWRRRVGAADVVMVAAPEYAGALAGAVKNAFDWLVGSADLYRKPMAVLTAGTSGGPNARRSMIRTLTWQGAYVIGELGIAAPRTKSDASGRLRDEATIDAIAALTKLLLAAPARSSAEVVDLARRVAGSMQIEPDHIIPGV
jgi:NAD(P)H-dependent FMN reductase